MAAVHIHSFHSAGQKLLSKAKVARGQSRGRITFEQEELTGGIRIHTLEIETKQDRKGYKESLLKATRHICSLLR